MFSSTVAALQQAAVGAAMHHPGLHGAMNPGMHPGMHGPWGGGAWWFLLIPLFWFVVIVVLAAIFGRRWRRRAWEHRAAYGYGPVVGAGFGPGYGPGHGQAYGQGAGAAGPWGWGQNQAVVAAEQTLAERFAKGDIDEVEYRARLEVLRANNTPPAPPAPPAPQVPPGK